MFIRRGEITFYAMLNSIGMIWKDHSIDSVGKAEVACLVDVKI